MPSNTPPAGISLFIRKSEIIRQFIRKHMGSYRLRDMKSEHERHARRLAGEGGVVKESLTTRHDTTAPAPGQEGGDNG